MFAASSLARPLQAALEGQNVRLVVGGSLDLARRVTELGETPDLLVLADEDVMRSLLMPEHVPGYARFARNRLVVAYGQRSRVKAADSTWQDVLTRTDVEIARADPARAPAGYRTLLAWQLAERRLGVPGLARRFADAAPLRNVRGSEAEVIALVESGSVDLAWVYESSAKAAGLGVQRLPPWMDFGEPAESTWYATATARIPSPGSATQLVVRGAPVTYVVAVPRKADHPEHGRTLARFLTAGPGRARLAAAGLDVLATALVVGAAW